jgi:hypothetical protein
MVKGTDSRAESKSRARHERCTAPTENLIRLEYYSKEQFRQKVLDDVNGLWEQLIKREARWTQRDLQTSGDARLVQLLRPDIGQRNASIVDVTQERDGAVAEREEAIVHRDLAVNERNELAFQLLRSLAPNTFNRQDSLVLDIRGRLSAKMPDPACLSDGKTVRFDVWASNKGWRPTQVTTLLPNIA